VAPSAAAATPGEPATAYPPARRDPSVVDDYHGTKVADPYRWLEDTDAPETRTWIEAQNALTFAFLERIPERKAITDRLTALWNYEKYVVPQRQGRRWFFGKNDGLQNQSVVYWTESLAAEPRVLLDPNLLAADGTVALAGASPSDDGKHFAYGLQTAGSDWVEWRVRDVASGKDLTDRLEWSKFGGASWTRNGKGFYYSRFPAPKPGEALTAVNTNQSIWYHRLGTPQSADKLVYERPDQPRWYMGGDVSEDGRYLFVALSKGTGPQNLLLYQDLKSAPPGRGTGKLTELIGTWEAEYSVLGNDGPLLYVKTDLDAPRGRVIAIDLRRPDKASWRELVAQAKEPIAGASLVGDLLFV
jgi:prolyl oligopeptidase